jgi:uncharacterized protein
VDQSLFEPVKIVIERRVRPGAKPQFERWTRSFMTTASRFPGLEGSSVFAFNSTGDYFVPLRFASQAHLENWKNAPEVRALCKQADAVSTATDRHLVRTGLETWFALPSRSIAPAVPPRWKMVLVTWLALFPQVVILFTPDSVSTSDGHPYCIVDRRSGGDAHLGCDAAPVGTPS